MLVRDSLVPASPTTSPTSPPSSTRLPCPFDARLVHYVTEDGRYSAWTLELDPVPSTPAHVSHALAASISSFLGLASHSGKATAVEEPPTLELPPEVAAALGGGGAAGDKKLPPPGAGEQA